jgi:hypothetical protein
MIAAIGFHRILSFIVSQTEKRISPQEFLIELFFMGLKLCGKSSKHPYCSDHRKVYPDRWNDRRRRYCRRPDPENQRVSEDSRGIQDIFLFETGTEIETVI